mmetsp:Transcript_56838/g.130523  ORF Transcript_56838/g.130523 Transcript_56838/m.130523 type:complete len:297 (+) Transcript_56838:272-1162(+)
MVCGPSFVLHRTHSVLLLALIVFGHARCTAQILAIRKSIPFLTLHLLIITVKLLVVRPIPTALCEIRVLPAGSSIVHLVVASHGGICVKRAHHATDHAPHRHPSKTARTSKVLLGHHCRFAVEEFIVTVQIVRQLELLGINHLVEKLDAVSVHEFVPERLLQHVGKQQQRQPGRKPRVHDGEAAHILVELVRHHLILAAEPEVTELTRLQVVADPNNGVRPIGYDDRLVHHPDCIHDETLKISTLRQVPGEEQEHVPAKLVHHLRTSYDIRPLHVLKATPTRNGVCRGVQPHILRI